MLNVGVIGLGRLGQVYAKDLAHLVPNARLLAVADEQSQLAETFSKEHNIEKWYASHQELIADKEIDAVAVITPTSTHGKVVIEAAENGKAIFCEKPISISLEESTKIVKVIEKTGAFFQMGFQRRFDRGYVEAKKKIEAGVIGTPVVLKSTSRDPFAPPMEFCDPEASGGLILDMGIHDFDVARMLMGEIESVYSIGGALVYHEMKSIGDIDNAIVTLNFVNGTLGVVDLSRNAVFGYDIRAEVLGSKGTLQIGYLRETPLNVLTKEGVTHDVVPHFMERFADAYREQIMNFVDNVLEDREPAITANDGIAALKVGIAATKSLKENRPVYLKDYEEGQY
ncbi:inositol 2-dehydrogenase [Bacteroidota bacterium]